MKALLQLMLWTGIISACLSPILSRGDILDHWTTNELPIAPYGLDGIVYGNGVFVAVAQWDQREFATLYSSIDGYSWTAPYTNYWWGVRLLFLNGRFYTVDMGGSVHTSQDGTNWTYAGNAGGVGNEIICANFGPSLSRNYIMVGPTYDSFYSTGFIFKSPDGVTWTQDTVVPAAGPISSVAFGRPNPAVPLAYDARFVAIGYNDGFSYVITNIFFSSSQWIRYPIAGGSIVNFANGIFIVPLNAGTNLVSHDGINWTPVPSGITNVLGKFTYSHGLYMSIQAGILSTSSDGTNWASYPHYIPPGTSRFGSPCIASDGTRLLSVSSELGPTGDYYTNNLVYISDPLVDLWATNTPSHQLALAGLVGRNYQIQSADKLAGNSTDWRTNTTLQPPSTPYLWTDPDATNSACFYRAVLLP